MVVEIIAVVFAILATLLKNKWLLFMSAAATIIYLGQINVLHGITAIIFWAALVAWFLSMAKGK